LTRRILYFLAVASLASCAATVALWLRSYQVGEGVWHTNLYAASSRGDIFLHGYFYNEMDHFKGLGLDQYGYSRQFPPYQEWSPSPTDLGLSQWRYSFAGLKFVGTDFSRGHIWDGGLYNFPQWELRVPDAWIVLLTAILPTMTIQRLWRGRQIVGHCRHCGYDLRATPERCPECGTMQAARG